MKVTYKKNFTDLQPGMIVYIIDKINEDYKVQPLKLTNGKIAKYGVLALTVILKKNEDEVICSNEDNPHCDFTLTHRDKYWLTSDAAFEAIMQLESVEEFTEKVSKNKEQLDDMSKTLSNLFSAISKSLSDANIKVDGNFNSIFDKLFNEKED